MFQGYPEHLLEIMRGTDPRSVAEHGIFTRPAEALPPDGWGRGRVTLVGDAAHPVRPTGKPPEPWLSPRVIDIVVAITWLGLGPRHRRRRCRAPRAALW